MKPSLAEQLSKIQFSTKDYGSLPPPDKTFEISKTLTPEDSKKFIDQWEKLKLIRKNLLTLDRYISYNKGETLNEWLSKNSDNIADRIRKELGDFNDKDKGISLYFLNLQKVYDDEEKKYDDYEGIDTMLEIDKGFFEPLNKERGGKRKNRIEGRNAKLRDFKKNDKGFLLIEEETEDNDESVKQATPGSKEQEKKIEAPVVKEPPIADNIKIVNADASNPAPPTAPVEVPEKSQEKDEMDKKMNALQQTINRNRTIGILFAGAFITVGLIIMANKKKS